MFGKKKVDNLSRYVDPSGGISNRQLRFGEWYVSHKMIFGKISVGLLAAWCALSIGFSVFSWGNYIFFGYNEDQQNLREQTQLVADYTAIQSTYVPRPPQVNNVLVFNSAPGRYDFVAQLKNSNERWVANVRYFFTFSGAKTQVHETTLLPGESRPVVVFGHESSVYPASSKFIIESIAWDRVNPHRIRDVASYMKPRLDFSAEDVTTLEAGLGGASTHQVSFNLVNNTAYSYWEPEFYVEILNGGQLSGVIYMALDGIQAGEAVPVDLRSFADELPVSSIGIAPVINIFDPDVYIDPGK